MAQNEAGSKPEVLVLPVAAPSVAWSASRIAEETGITATFIGTPPVAITTSLPKPVVFIMGIISRAERRFTLIEPDGLLMIVAFLLGRWLSF